MILSVSRHTDTPCRHSEWPLRRLYTSGALVHNPHRPGQLCRAPLSPTVVDAIVFWAKDPIPLLPWLDELGKMGYRYLFQFTPTPYGLEVEPGLRDERAIVETFQVLGHHPGWRQILQRYDPILFTDVIGLAWCETRFHGLYKALSPFTDQVTVSFLDLYPDRPMSDLRLLNALEMQELASMLGQTTEKYHLLIVACYEAGNLSPHGINQVAYIDRARLEHSCGEPLWLGPNRGQRPGRGYCESVDIDACDTCPSGCRCCHVNRIPNHTAARRAEHTLDNPLLTDIPNSGDTAADLPTYSCRDGQLHLP